MLSRLIYTSTSLCSSEQARSLCLHSQVANAQRHVTGALYLADGAFLQYLEGDEFVLATLYHRIKLDHRHKDCKLLDSRLVSKRAFRAWSMEWLAETAADDPAMQAIVSRHTYLPAIDEPAAVALFLALSRVTRPT